MKIIIMRVVVKNERAKNIMLGADTSPLPTGSLLLWPQSNLINILHYLIVLALPYYLVINYKFITMMR
jgi:hypothetical protein